MGYVVKDFECLKCGITERVVPWDVVQLVCCGQTAYALISAPKLRGADSFNPHFDITQGVFFKSPEHKKAWLESKQKEQVGGSSSPRSSGGGRVLCSETQSKKFVNFKSHKIKQEDIPGLKPHNRRTSVDS